MDQNYRFLFKCDSSHDVFEKCLCGSCAVIIQKLTKDTLFSVISFHALKQSRRQLTHVLQVTSHNSPASLKCSPRLQSLADDSKLVTQQLTYSFRSLILYFYCNKQQIFKTFLKGGDFIGDSRAVIFICLSKDFSDMLAYARFWHHYGDSFLSMDLAWRL